MRFVILFLVGLSAAGSQDIPQRRRVAVMLFCGMINWTHTLALMQVSGGSQSFNAVNVMRLLGRWMRMVMMRRMEMSPSNG